MYERDREVTGEHWMGVQEAATYLGIHRATLFRAVSSGMIAADYTTPKGRVRFRQETVDAFKEKLKEQAATSHQHVDVPVLGLARLANLCSGSSPSTNPIVVIREVTQFLCPPVGLFDMVVVAIRVPNATDPFALRVLAEHGFPERLKATYECLRPCEDFPVTVAMRTGVPAICDDIRSHPFPHATAQRAMMLNGIGSYAAFPIASGSGQMRTIIGTLVVCGRAPHTFERREEVFLSGLADALSACITNSALRASLIQTDDVNALDSDTALTIASSLLETAYDQASRARIGAGIGAGIGAEPSRGIESLCDMFAEQSHALAAWVDGFPPSACGDSRGAGQESEKLRQYRKNLESLVVRTRDAPRLNREQWRSEVTAVALPVPLLSGGRGAVGAVWPGRRVDVAAEGILLSTLASACTVVSQYSMMEGDSSRKRS